MAAAAVVFVFASATALRAAIAGEER
jgi:hypothetical protein